MALASARVGEHAHRRGTGVGGRRVRAVQRLGRRGPAHLDDQPPGAGRAARGRAPPCRGPPRRGARPAPPRRAGRARAAPAPRRPRPPCPGTRAPRPRRRPRPAPGRRSRRAPCPGSPLCRPASGPGACRARAAGAPASSRRPAGRTCRARYGSSPRCCLDQVGQPDHRVECAVAARGGEAPAPPVEHVEAHHVVGGASVRDRVRAARVVADHAAERGPVLRRGVRAEPQTVRRRGRLKVAHHHARLDRRGACLGIDRDRAQVHRGVHHDPGPHGVAGYGGAASPQGQRRARRAGHPVHRDKVVDVPRDHDDLRDDAVVRRVTRVHRASERGVLDIPAHQTTQLFEQLGGRDRRRRAHGCRVGGRHTAILPRPHTPPPRQSLPAHPSTRPPSSVVGAEFGGRHHRTRQKGTHDGPVSAERTHDGPVSAERTHDGPVSAERLTRVPGRRGRRGSAGVAAPAQDRGPAGLESGHRDPERRAGHVVQPDAVEEVDRLGVATVLAAHAERDVGPRRAALLDRDLDQAARRPGCPATRTARR